MHTRCDRHVPKAGLSASVAAAVLSLIGASSAHAGGLYVQEFLDTYQGAANAGAQALGTDPSTVFHNPAAMSRLEGRQLSFGGALIFGDVEFSPSPTTPVPGGDGGQQASTAPAISAFYTNRFDDRLTFGAGVYSVSGAVLDPSSDWAGRFQVTEISLLTLAAMGAVSYRINEAWSIGASVGVVYGSLDFDLDVAAPSGGEAAVNLDGDDVRPMAIIGVHYEPNDQWRFGLSVMSGFELNLDGDLSVQGPPVSVGTDTTINFAPTVRAAFAYQASEDLTVMGSLGYERWSDLDNLYVSTARGTGAVPRNWDDTYHAALGFRYQASDDLMVQAGMAYDSNPVDAEFRTADAPIDRQVRIAAGAEYRLRDNLKVHGSLSYIDLGDGDISSSNLVGSYSDNRLLVATLGLRFDLGKRSGRR